MLRNFLILIFFYYLLYAFALECNYCPLYSSPAECNAMNLTQICINETQCGLARFIKKKPDKGELYPYGNVNHETYSSIVKMGCMYENYCTEMGKKWSEDLNKSECIFCDNNLCTLKLPLLCVNCEEADDMYCILQTEPTIECLEGEVCYTKRLKSSNNTYKRGCIDPKKCLKEEYCEYCDTDICWPNPVLYPEQEDERKIKFRGLEINKENYIKNFIFITIICVILSLNITNI